MRRRATAGSGWGGRLFFGVVLPLGAAAWLAAITLALLPVAVGGDANAALLAPLVALFPALLAPLALRIVDRRRRLARLDAAFAAIGFGAAELGTGRQWHGRRRRRDVRAYTYGDTGLDLYVDAEFSTRAAFARRGRGPRGLPRVAVPDLELRVWAADEAWVRAWLTLPGVEEALLALLPADATDGRRVTVGPGGVCWSVRRGASLDAAALRAAFAGLAELADAARMVRPSDPVAETWRERVDRNARGVAAWPALIAAAAAPVVVVLSVLVGALVLARLR